LYSFNLQHSFSPWKMLLNWFMNHLFAFVGCWIIDDVEDLKSNWCVLPILMLFCSCYTNLLNIISGLLNFVKKVFILFLLLHPLHFTLSSPLELNMMLEKSNRWASHANEEVAQWQNREALLYDFMRRETYVKKLSYELRKKWE